MTAARRRGRRDAGQVTAFVVVMLTALILVVGLVLDGGLILAARLRALDQAQEAARAGAQAIDLQAYRQRGVLQLQPAQAVAAAQTYLNAVGASGTARVAGQQVIVNVRRTQQMQILSLVGLGSVTVHATAHAHPVRGITTVIP